MLKDMQRKRETQGFAHYVVLIGIAVGVVVVGVGAMVIHANHSHSAKSNIQAVNTASENHSSSLSAQSSSAASTITPAPTPISVSSSSNSTASHSKSSSSTTAKTTSTGQSSTSPSPTPAPQTPLSALTAIITGLDNGTGAASVTANTVTIPGPITDAKGRPIVFTLNGQTYFAYTQESPPDFNQSAAQTANSMAIVNATVSSPSLTQAHLDKIGELVDENLQTVGYSTGGN